MKNQIRTTLKLGTVIQRCFMAIISLLVLNAVLALWAMNTLKTTSNWVARSHAGGLDLEQLRSGCLGVEAGVRGYVITGKEEFLAPYVEGQRQIKEEEAQLRDSFKDSAQLPSLKGLEDAIQKQLDHTTAIVADKKAGRNAEAIEKINSDAGKALMNDVNAKDSEIEKAETGQLAERQKAADSAQIYSKTTLVISGAVAILVSLFALFYVLRRVVPPINVITNTLGSASAEIAATVEQHEKTTSQQAASVNEATTTMEELEVSFRQAAEAGASVAERARKSAEVATDGARISQKTLDGMTDLKEKVAAIAGQILKLSEQTSQIGNITKVVSDLASQTNMLALNAAVEAARAGEHGKGFAVVSAEIRKLADQSRKAAEHINTLVADVQKATNATVMVAEEGTKTVASSERLVQASAEAFTTIATVATGAAEAALQSALGTKQQQAAVRQVSQAMADINAGARETAAGITQTKTGILQLRAASQTLAGLV